MFSFLFTFFERRLTVFLVFADVSFGERADKGFLFDKFSVFVFIGE